MAMAFTVRKLLLFSSLLLLQILVLSQNNGRIDVGRSLTATPGNSSWISPSGDFAFGFSKIENNDSFLLSIWYAKLPDRTIVWHARTDDMPALAPTGSTVNLTSDSGLVLKSPQGGSLWNSSITSIGSVVANGIMSDTGNFVLVDDSSENLWQSFDNPTDTMLPGQTVEKGGKLSSRKSQSDYSKGRYQLRLQDDGNLVLNTINLPTDFANNPYNETGTTTGTVPGSEGKQLVLNGSGYMYVLRENGEKFDLTLPQRISTTGRYTRVTLDFDGILAQYSHARNFSGNVGWSPIWTKPDDICTSNVEEKGVGVCGHNSICTSRAGRPTCKCPTGFSLRDPNEPYGGCKADFRQGCDEDELSQKKDLYKVELLQGINFPFSDYEQFAPMTAEQCNKSCYEDCLCAASVFNTQHLNCWKKASPLLNGRSDSNITQTFIKVGKNNSTREVHPNDKKKSQTTLERVELALLGTSLLVNFILASALCIGCFFVSRIKHVRSREMVVDSNLRSFSYEELQEATNGFSEELGRGSFGVVYKGTIQTGSELPVAVKKLHFVTQQDVGDVEFKTEVNVIGKIHHKNLVHLVGYCDEGQQRLLVYEFLNNGTLASLLFADVKPSWGQRIEIAYGVAKGLRYLHEECSTAIIHCDIKPQNILLDDYYNARISDFGLAKLLMMNQSHTHTAIRGTKGYVAPEWFRNMPITTKVDVYSFGVVLLEIIFCRRSVDMENTKEEEAILTDWVYDCYWEGKLDTLVDHEAEGLDDGSNLEKLVMVGIWCIQEDPSLRPTMKKVVQMLEGVVEVLIPPCPSPYNNRSTIG